MLARRTFLRNLALVSAAAALRPSGLNAAANSVLRASGTADLLTGRNFTGLRGERFTVTAADGSEQSCVLADVREFTHDARLENFALHFEGSSSAPLAEGTYRFSHDEIGSVELFVAARSLDADTHGYEAVINRLV